MVSDCIYRVSLGSDFPHWERFNLFLTVVGYDPTGEKVCYVSSTTKNDDGTIEVATPPCHHIDIYGYVIANSFPETIVIREAPPFQSILRVYRDGDLVESSHHGTNQWGGLTVSGYRIPKE